MEIKAIKPPVSEWQSMFKELLEQLDALPANHWLEVSGIEDQHDARVKQINLLGTVRKYQPFGANYRLSTMLREGANGRWSLAACKVKKEKRK